MGKPNLKSLSPMDFTKMTPTRNEKIEAASTSDIPKLSTYKANVLAKRLHPQAQHLIVEQVIEHNSNMKSYVMTFDSEAGTNELAWFSAGQYLSITLEIGNHKLTRPYSISSSPKDSTNGKYMITIKRVGGGLASEFILDNWAVGTKVVASAPLGQFTYEPLRDGKTIIGVAGGSGITPFRSLAYAIADGDEDASLVLLYGSKTLEEAVFSDEISKLASTCDRIKLINVLSDEPSTAPSAGCEKGFITADLIKKYAPSSDYSIFICGPQAMYKFVDSEIATLGIASKYVRHELFGEYFNPSNDAQYVAPASETVSITVRQAGLESTISASINTSILRSIEASGILCPARCRSGECGWCHSKLVSGDVYIPKSVDGRREADIKFGYIHPCCTFPLSDIVIEVAPVAATAPSAPAAPAAPAVPAEPEAPAAQ